MRHILLASAATASLAFALPAAAQTLPDTVPAAPPLSKEIPDANAALEGAAAATITAPEGPVVESQTEAEAQASADSPETAAAAAATAMASSPATPTTPAAETDAARPMAMLANASAVCQSRVTAVHFGARGSALNQENRNAIEYAVDAASVCDLEQVLITDRSEGRISNRRAGAVRAALIARGVPAANISVAEEANTDAEASSTGRLDVRMTFAGVADASTPATTVEPPASPNS